MHGDGSVAARRHVVQHICADGKVNCHQDASALLDQLASHGSDIHSWLEGSYPEEDLRLDML
jgi:hypothetical protein